MKNRITQTSVIALIFITVILSSCRKEEENEIPITEDDASDLITYALQSSSGGYASETSEAAEFMSTEGLRSVQSQSLQCGVPFDSTISLTYNGTVSASYTLNWDLLLTCDNLNIPQSLSFASPYSGNYDGPLMSSSNSGNLNWTVTGLAAGNSVPYTFNGSFTRSGSHTSKVRNKSTFSSELNITLTNITVDKVSQHITGGTGTASIDCKSSTGINYTFSGNIVFSSTGTAVLTIGSHQYTINLY